jgi:hypothetical protein
MGLGVTTGGRGGELRLEFARALVLLLRDELSVSLSEAAEVGREIVSTEEVRRMTLPMRADHFGLLGLVLLMVRRVRREDEKDRNDLAPLTLNPTSASAIISAEWGVAGSTGVTATA